MKPLDPQFPEIVAELQKIRADSFLLDGEIAAFEETGKSSFQLLQGRINRRNPRGLNELIEKIPASYMVFDVLACQGFDLRSVTLAERRRVLAALLPHNELIRPVEVLSERGREFFELVSQAKLEGVVAKHNESTYSIGRSTQWRKIKTVQEDFFAIGGWTEPAGGRKYLGALLLGVYEGEQLHFVGRVGGGFNESRLRSIHQQLQPLQAEASPFQHYPKEVADAHWVDPVLVCRVRYNELTRDRILRAPVFLRMEPDIDPSSCRFDLPVNPDDEEMSDPLAPFSFLSNLDKPFWPEDGITKRDLVRYYYEVAPILLPYLRDRPMNMERYPDGWNGKSFYQKDTPDFFPDWIRTEPVDSESQAKTIRYTVVDDRDTLVYLANLACIPLHPWSSRIGTIGCPDFLIIDLDPDPKLGFGEVCRFALRIRGILDQLELESFPKTSGSKGIHILVPLEPLYSYAMVRSFGEIVARLAVQGAEDLATFDRSMERRKGRIYIDYLQNGMGKTIVSPYCVRPRPGAPVSTPLEWNEVAPGIRPEAFHIRNILRRIERKGDLFLPVLQRKQRLEDALERLEDLMKDDAS